MGSVDTPISSRTVYDAIGRLLQIVLGQSNPQTRSFTYDSLGRLRTETHPESGTSTYNYDDAGTATAHRCKRR